VYLSALARVRRFRRADLERALYENKTLVRMLGMRRTLFVVTRDTAGIMDAACTKLLVPQQRRRLIRWIEDQGIANDGGRWIDRVSERTLAALRERGEAAAVDLSKDIPELALQLRFDTDSIWARDVGMSTRILFLLATEGKIVRTRPRGSWVSGQYRWAPLETWLGGPLGAIERADASAELTRRYLSSFGPATEADLRWWTGWTVKQTAAALEAACAGDVELDGGVRGYVLEGDTRRVRTPAPWVRLLPGLDPTIMGWKQREWYLGEHRSTLFDRNGNAGPTVVANGHTIGGWSQRADGTVVVELLEKVDSAIERRVRREQERVEEWLGHVRVIPRFRTPLEKDLANGQPA
jgi:Winged helix DNA-binding domain